MIGIFLVAGNRLSGLSNARAVPCYVNGFLYFSSRHVFLPFYHLIQAGQK